MKRLILGLVLAGALMNGCSTTKCEQVRKHWVGYK